MANKETMNYGTHVLYSHPGCECHSKKIQCKEHGFTWHNLKILDIGHLYIKLFQTQRLWGTKCDTCKLETHYLISEVKENEL